MLPVIRIVFLISILLGFLPCLASAQNRPANLPVLDSIDLAGMLHLAGTLSETALAMEAEMTEKEPVVESAQSTALERLTLAKQDSSSSKIQLDSLTKEAKRAKDAYKTVYNLRLKANKTRQFVADLYSQDSLNLRKNLPKAWKQVSQLYDQIYPPESTETPNNDSVASEGPKVKKEKKKKAPAPNDSNTSPIAVADQSTNPSSIPPKQLAKYNPSKDVMLTPPSPPCVIARSSRDEFSGEYTKEMASTELFRYTNPALKAYLQGRTHVICEAALVSIGTNASLHLTFIINDPNARKAFGHLEKNGLAKIKFMDGSIFELQNAINDEGVFTPNNESSIFRAEYPLNAEALKKIRRTELDTMRILWSKGYDDYDVQQVDLLMRQAACLFSK